MADQLMLQDCKGVMRAQVCTAQSKEEQKQDPSTACVRGDWARRHLAVSDLHVCSITCSSRKVFSLRTITAAARYVHWQSHEPQLHVIMHKLLWGCQQIYYPD